MPHVLQLMFQTLAHLLITQFPVRTLIEENLVQLPAPNYLAQTDLLIIPRQISYADHVADYLIK